MTEITDTTTGPKVYEMGRNKIPVKADWHYPHAGRISIKGKHLGDNLFQILTRDSVSGDTLEGPTLQAHCLHIDCQFAKVDTPTGIYKAIQIKDDIGSEHESAASLLAGRTCQIFLEKIG